MTVSPDLRSMFSADVAVGVWQPTSPADVYFVLQLEIGVGDHEGADVYQVVVCTPEGLRRQAAPSGVLSERTDGVLADRSTLILDEFSWEQLRAALEARIHRCAGPDQVTVQHLLQRYFRWEFEPPTTTTSAGLPDDVFAALEEAVMDDDPAPLREALGTLSAGDRDHLVEFVFLEGAVACAHAVLDSGVDRDTRINGASLLERACAAGSRELLDLLLDRGASIAGIPLVHAAHAKSISCVRRLLAVGASVDQGFPDQPSALGVATALDHEEMADTLREAGATSLTGRGPDA